MKYIPTLGIGLLMLLPAVSFAQTAQPDQSAIIALLNALTQQVQALEARLTALENEASSTPSFGGTQKATVAIDLSQTPQQIEQQESAACMDYTISVPFKEDDGWYTPVVGSMCVIQPNGGRECGC